MGLKEKLRSMIVEEDPKIQNPNSSPPTQSIPYSIPTVPSTSSYATPVSTSGPYNVLLETLNQVNHPGMAFFRYLDNLKDEIPDEAQRYRLALKLSGVPREQITEALKARRQALQNEINTVNDTFVKKWANEIGVRETRIGTLQSEIGQLNVRVATLTTQISTLNSEKDVKASEMQNKKGAFDFAAQTISSDLDTADNLLQSYLK
jgi:chromosome segregation ATPase